jgi:hypothetical protein
MATTKIFGSAKIPTPNFGPIVAESKSLLAAVDISRAQSILKNLQGQGTVLLNQAQGQATALAGQAQGQVTALASQARTVATTAIPRIV